MSKKGVDTKFSYPHQEDIIFSIHNDPIKDPYSSFFEKNIKHYDRKKLGQFYTHKELVKYIFSTIPVNENSRILDPTAGAGAFLISALTYNNNNDQNIYGIDIDANALKLCVQNISSNAGATNSDNFICANTIHSELRELFPEIYSEGGFDVVIGNPPYQHVVAKKDYNPDDEVFKPILNGIVNAASLIIAKSLQYLKPGGFLGFVLPKGILRVGSFSNVRKYIATNFLVKEIFDLGHYFKDVRGDQIIVIIQKCKPINYQNDVLINIHNKNKPLENKTSYRIKQQMLIDYDFYPVYRNESIIQLSAKLLGIKTTLDSICDGNIFRGINLSSKNDAISKNHQKNCITIYRGDSVGKFATRYPLYLDLKKIKNDNKINRLKNEKIILQNLCSKEGGIAATISSANELNMDTVTNILSAKNDLKFLLGIINSKFADFFLLHIIFLSSNFTMHTDRKYIGQLPIVLPDTTIIKKISAIVDAILKLNGEKGTEYQNLYIKLNKLVYSIYELTNEEINIIESCLKDTLSSRNYYGPENE